MATCVVQLAQPHKTVHLVPASSAHYSSREAPSKFFNRGPHLFGHESLIGVVDYRGKSPIIVQEHHYLFPLGGIDYLLEHVQSRRMVEHPRTAVVLGQRTRGGLHMGRGRSFHGVDPGADPLGAIDLEVLEQLPPRDLEEPAGGGRDGGLLQRGGVH